MTHTTQAAIAWTLIHFCWQAATIAAVYRIFSYAFARRTSHARYLLALCTLLLMLAVSVATFAWAEMELIIAGHILSTSRAAASL